MSQQSENRNQLFKHLNHDLNVVNVPHNQAIINQIIKSSKQNKVHTNRNSDLTNHSTLKMPLVIALLKLYKRKTYKFIYHHNSDEHKSARDIKSSQDFPTLCTLVSLQLANIQSHQKKHNKDIIFKAKLTPLGKEFVKIFLLPQYQSIFRKNRFNKFKLICKTSLLNDDWMVGIGWLILDFLGSTIAMTLIFGFLGLFIPVQIFYNSIVNAIGWIVYIAMMVISSAYEMRRYIKHNIQYRAKRNNYNLIANIATQEKVIQFLNQHNVKAPNLRFTLDSEIPSLYQAIFTN